MTFLTCPVVRFQWFLYKTLSLRSPSGGAAMGGIAAHGYVNGKTGVARQGCATRTAHGRTSGRARK